MKHSPIRHTAIAYLWRRAIRHANFWIITLTVAPYTQKIHAHNYRSYSLVNTSYCVLGFLNQFHWQDVTNLEPCRLLNVYCIFSFKAAWYADMALIFVDSDVFFFTMFYPRSLFKVVSWMSQAILEMIAVIKPRSSMVPTQTTKTRKQNNKLCGLQLIIYFVTTQFLLIFLGRVEWWSINSQSVYWSAHLNHCTQVCNCQKIYSAPWQAHILFLINVLKQHVLHPDYLQPDVSDRTRRSLGKQSPSTPRLTLCQCCQCLCNSGQKSIMSKLISCTRKLKRSCLKREEKMVNIALWKIDSASQTSAE